MPSIVISKETHLTGAAAKAFFAFLERRQAWGYAFLGVSKYYYGKKRSDTDLYVFDVRNEFFFSKKETVREYALYFPEGRLGEGSYAKVYSLGAIVCATEIAYLQGGGYSAQVIKVQALQDGHREHAIAGQLPHLAVQAYIAHSSQEVGESKSGLVMKRMPGSDLYDFLKANAASFTWPKRLKLQCAILNAIYSQVTRYGIIHRDIKLENIMLDVRGEDFEVNIIDVGFAIKIPEGALGLMDSRVCGTVFYFAKEIVDAKCKLDRGTLNGSYWQTLKIDVFSTGRLLCEIWGGQDRSYQSGISTQYYKNYLEKNQHLDFSSLFRGLAIPANYRELVESLLTRMLQLRVDDRLSMSEALQASNAIYQTYMASVVQQVPLSPVVALEIPIVLEVASLPAEKGDVRGEAAAVDDNPVFVPRAMSSCFWSARNSLSFQPEEARRRDLYARQSLSDMFFGDGEAADVADNEATAGAGLGNG